jgi:hypothetical protein
MSFAAKLTLKPRITLSDLVKPRLNKREQAAIKRALKNAKRDQDKLRKQATQL